MKYLHIVGARPNFMKLSPLYRAFKESDFEQYVLHTGQHYDEKMSDIFFKELNIPEPEFNLGIGSGSQSFQTAQMMIEMEKKMIDIKPDWVIVYGDVNSTLAAVLVCAKLRIKVAHIESGLRSYDRAMPEEVNRIVTDRLSDLLFTPSIDGNFNLQKEGIEENKIVFVGNIMIDSLIQHLETVNKIENVVSYSQYILLTLHRPSNVDDSDSLVYLIDNIIEISKNVPIVFPIHPRTRKRIEEIYGYNIAEIKNIKFIEPVGYINFIKLQKEALAVITDSGGIQEETTFLGIPCLTLRENTERPVTVDVGTNTLIGNDMDLLKSKLEEIFEGTYKKGEVPDLWDGKTGQRIADYFKTI